jgi:uncharacterized protein YndB with AHSA1/START domain
MEATTGAPRGERRILLIADLSGYTGYLMRGEVDEAPLIAGHLVETMLEQLSSEFEVAGLEGDAAFVHAPLHALTGEGLLAAIARSHRAFRQRIVSLRQATTCPCEACRQVPTLELKFFVHVGAVIRQRILGRDEIAGRDVILLHRLLKASEPAREGLERFALFTAAAVEALRIDPETHGMRRVTQAYEHLGEIVGWTGDPETWGDVDSPADGPADHGEEALRSERIVPAPITEVWDLLTLPELRERWEGIDRIEEGGGADGRGVGTLSRCVAHQLSTIEEIVEWRPPVRFARRVRRGAELTTVVHELEPAGGGGTRLSVSWHPGDGASVSAEEAGEHRRRLARLERAASTLSG